MSNYNEKRVPQYNLDEIKKLISSDKYIITGIAKNNALKEFYLKSRDIPVHVLRLSNQNFYKSMTSELDNRLWQDVYHLQLSHVEEAYIKLQQKGDLAVIIQFKKK